jgi:hypothetical protein
MCGAVAVANRGNVMLDRKTYLAVLPALALLAPVVPAAAQFVPPVIVQPPSLPPPTVPPLRPLTGPTLSDLPPAAPVPKPTPSPATPAPTSPAGR